MKKGLFLLSLIVTFYALGTVSASAVTNDTVKVGLRYGSSVMSSANLENDEGSGYEFGYFEDDRTFVSLGETDETAITMEPAGRDGIQVTITGTDRVLYESREDTLAVMPQGPGPRHLVPGEPLPGRVRVHRQRRRAAGGERGGPGGLCEGRSAL